MKISEVIFSATEGGVFSSESVAIIHADIHRYNRQQEKGTTEDEMAGWHHQLDGHECE